jgi:hypothetical protein
MNKLIRNLAVFIGGSVLILPLLATVLLFSSSGASDADNANMLLSRLDNSLLQNKTGKTAEAFFSLEQPLRGIAWLGNTEAYTHHLNTDISKLLRKISSGDLDGTELATDGWRNRIAQPAAMIMLGAGMIALATLRRKQQRSQSKTQPDTDNPAGRMVFRNE